MLDSDELNSNIRKLATAYEMMQKRTGRPDKYIHPEDMKDGLVTFTFGVALHPFGDVIDLNKQHLTVRTAFLKPFIEGKDTMAFKTFEDFYRMVDIWHRYEQSFLLNKEV